MAFDLGSVTARVDLDITGFKKGMSEAESNIKNLSSRLDDIGGGIKRFGQGMSLFVTTPLLGAGGAAIKAAADFEQTEIAFTTMLGSAEKASELLQDLTDFAVKTPFTLSGIQESAKQLLAMGIETDKLLPTLKSLGDVSAGLSIDLDRVAYNFGQVKAQGQLTGVELKDFARAGVPLIAELAKNLGVAESEIKEMVSAGEIGFDAVEQAFMTMTSEGGKFNDLMQAQSTTTAGQFSNLKDSVELLARSIGEQMLPMALELVQKLKSLVDWFGGLTDEQKKTILIIGAVVAAIGPLAIVLGTLISIIGTVITIVGALGTALAFLAANPIVLLIGAVALLAFLIVKNWDQIKAAFELGKMFISDIMNKIKDFLGNIGGKIKDALISPFKQAWENIKETVNKIKDALDFTKRNSPSVVDIVNNGVKRVNRALEGLEYNANITPDMAAATVSNQNTGPSIYNVKIDLNGAVIADQFGAERMGAIIGDGIIDKLKQNVRF